jgi:hypothetical protein
MPRKYAPARYTQSISFRLTSEQAVVYDALRATFEDFSWAAVGRWMIEDEVILGRIKQRLETGE